VIIDSSALLAILLKEPEQFRIADAITLSENRRVSAATSFEAGMLMEGRHGPEGSENLDELIAEYRLQVVPFTAEHAELAREAFRRFGKGRHPAALNFGDCMSYALAKAMDEPLLFKGDDFSRTDIEAAAY
jgi:ribonuclease VapC